MSAILFVCRANVCRSPVMAFGFASVYDNGVAVSVSSAGTETSRDLRICEVGASLMGSRPEGVARAASHRPTALAAEQIARHDLIIVASRDERAATARMLPSSRGGLFTLKEAIALGRKAFSPEELASVRGAQGTESLAAYAYLLDARRGTLDLPPRRRLLRRALSPAAQLDIPDFHHERRRTHVLGVERVLEEASVLAEQVSRGMRQIDQFSGS